AVGGVLVPPAPDGLAGARGGLVGHLDATLGLERITEGPTGVIWRVSATPGADGRDHAPARVQLLDADGVRVGTVASGPLEAHDRVAVDAALVVLAERADPGWRAS